MTRITRNEQLVEAFFKGADSGKLNNLRIEKSYLGSTLLVNYATTLAEITKDGIVHVNITKYSNSTSRIQSYIRHWQPDYAIEHSNLYRGVRSLAG